MATADPTRRDYYVYGLFDEEARIVYVGKGNGRRLFDHENPCRMRSNSLKVRTFRRIVMALGEIPKVKIAEELTEAEALALEIRLIAVIGRHPQGPLLNRTSGGEGGGGYPVTSRTREKRSRALKGRIINQRTRDAVPLANSTRPITEDLRDKISVGVLRAQPWTKWSPEGRARIISHITNPDVIAKRLAASIGRKWPADERERRIIAMREARAAKAEAARKAESPDPELPLGHP